MKNKKITICLQFLMLFFGGYSQAQTKSDFLFKGYQILQDNFSTNNQNFQTTLPQEYKLYMFDTKKFKNSLSLISGQNQVTLVLGEDYRWEIKVEKFDIRAKNYVLNIPSASNQRIINANKNNHTPEIYKGFDSNMQQVFLSLDIDFFAIIQQDNQYYILESYKRYDPNSPADHLILYKSDQLPWNNEEQCKMIDLRIEEIRASSPTYEQAQQPNACVIAELAIAVDSAYVAKEGGVLQAESMVISILSGISTFYTPEGIEHALVEIYIAGVNEIVSETELDGNTILSKFRLWDISTSSGFVKRHDISTLWTGRNFSEGTKGLAWISGVCNNLTYNLCERQGAQWNNTIIQAHELGHNWGAEHNGSGTDLMTTFVNTGATQFSPLNKTQIAQTKAASSCFLTCDSLPPLAGFNLPSSFCVNQPICFIDTSWYYPESWKWQFQGGIPASSTTKQACPVFNSAGVYNVTLIVSNAGGSDTLVQSVTVSSGVSLTASATPSTGSNGTATVIATNGTPPYTYLWLIQGSPTTQTITGLAPGTYRVMVTDANGCNKQIEVVVDVATALASVDEAVDDIFVTHNPSNNLFYVNLHRSHIANLVLQVYNVTGHLLFQKITYDNISGDQIKIDMSEYSAGIYFIRIVIEEEALVINKKLILQK